MFMERAAKPHGLHSTASKHPSVQLELNGPHRSKSAFLRPEPMSHCCCKKRTRCKLKFGEFLAVCVDCLAQFGPIEITLERTLGVSASFHAYLTSELPRDRSLLGCLDLNAHCQSCVSCCIISLGLEGRSQGNIPVKRLLLPFSSPRREAGPLPLQPLLRDMAAKVKCCCGHTHQMYNSRETQ